MSLKQEIETWVAALAAYDHSEFDNALRCFAQIADTSKILFNTGVIHATLGEHALAVDCYQRAVQLDQYLAVAYFQQGVSNFLMGDFEEALANFNDTLLYLRGNNNIDYEQLGLKFKLYSCEVLFNRGLCYIYLQQKDAGMQDLIFAAKEKAVPDHDVIEEAIREQAEGYTVFSIPVGVVYRPNEAKVKNLKTRDFLGKARLVAAQNQPAGDPRRQATLAALGIDDRPQEKLSYAAMKMVKPDLRSRTRQQSEPPLHRNVFPPTPPPEPERPISSHSKHREGESSASSVPHQQTARSVGKPLRLELGAAAFEQSKPQSAEKPRLAPRRAESERPSTRRDYSSAPRGFGERRREERASSRNAPEVRVEEDPIEAYSQQTYASEQQQRPLQSGQPRARVNPQHLSYPAAIDEGEEDEEGGGGGEGDERADSVPDEPLAFEIVPPRPKAGPDARHRSVSRRAPDLRKIRIKVHAEDMRYVLTPPTIQYDQLVEQIRAKFAFSGAFKLKIKDDEGDMVTMGDQDDLDMAVGTCKANAARERSDMGKMELWVQEL